MNNHICTYFNKNYHSRLLSIIFKQESITKCAIIDTGSNNLYIDLSLINYMNYIK